MIPDPGNGHPPPQADPRFVFRISRREFDQAARLSASEIQSAAWELRKRLRELLRQYGYPVEEPK